MQPKFQNLQKAKSCKRYFATSFLFFQMYGVLAGEKGFRGSEGEVNVLKGKFRSNFFETIIPSPFKSKKLKERLGNMTKTKQATNSKGKDGTGMSEEKTIKPEKAANTINLKEAKGAKVNNKKGQRTKTATETQTKAPKEATDAKKSNSKEGTDNDKTKKSSDKKDDLAKAGKATLNKASGVKILSNDTNGKFRLRMNGSIRIKTNKEGKPNVNLEIKPNDQLKDRKSLRFQTESNGTQKSSESQKLSQSQASRLSEESESNEETSGKGSLENDLLLKKLKARLDYETRSSIHNSRSIHSFS